MLESAASSRRRRRILNRGFLVSRPDFRFGAIVSSYEWSEKPGQVMANTRFEVSAAAVQRQESVANACFSEGFARTLAWYLANEGWWRPVVERAQITR